MKKTALFLLIAVLVFAAMFSGCKKAETPATEAPAAEEAAPAATEAAAPAAEEAAPAAAEEAAPAADAAAPAADAAMPEVCKDAAGCAVVKAGETIKIGVAGPITGEYAMYGEDISDSEKLAVSQLEPLNGFSWELLAEDTQGAAEAAVAVANKWITDPSFVAVAGNVFTGESAASIPIFEKAQIPMLSPSATGAELCGDNTVFNRVVFQDATQGKFAAQFMAQDLGYTKIAVLHDGLDYGKGIADNVVAELKAEGIEPVAYEAVTPGEADYSAVLTSVASKSPEIIYYGGYTAELSVIANQLGQVGLAGVPVFSDDGAYGVEFIEKAGKNAEGCYGTSSVPPSSPAKDAFDAAYKETYAREAGSKSTFPWFSYDVVNVLASKIAEVAVVGDDGNLYVPRTALVKAVRATKGYQGITGEITCDEVGECNASGPTFYVVKDGEWVVASGK